MMRKFVFLINCLLFFIACSQDPFRNYPDYIKKAIPYEEIAKQSNIHLKNRVISKNFASITASDVWRTSVGDDFAMDVTGLVFLNDSDFDGFNIELVSSLPNSEVYSFEEIERTNKGEKRYLFRWSPSPHFMGDQSQRVINMKFQLTTYGTLDVQKTQNFPLFVYKDSIPIQPEIISVVMSSTVRLGDSETIKISVRDESSSIDLPPSIIFNDTNNNNPVPFISFLDKRMIREHYWEFEFNIDTDLLEEFIDPLIYSLDVIALSALHQQPSQRKIEITFINEDFNPQIIGPQSITVYRGGRNYILLQVVNHPFDEILSVKLQDFSTNYGQIEVISEDTPSHFNVFLMWDVPLSEGQEQFEQEIQLNLLITSRREVDGQTVVEDFLHTVTVYFSTDDINLNLDQRGI